jgi:hypothetical protein
MTNDPMTRCSETVVTLPKERNNTAPGIGMRFDRLTMTGQPQYEWKARPGAQQIRERSGIFFGRCLKLKH